MSRHLRDVGSRMRERRFRRMLIAPLCLLAAAACGPGEPPPPPPAAAVAPAPALPTARARLDEVQRLASALDYDAAIKMFEAVKTGESDAITALDGLKMVVVYTEIGDQPKFEALTRWLVARYSPPKSATDAERSVKGYIVSRDAKDPGLLAHAVEMTRYAGEHAAADGAGQYQGFFDTSRGVAAFRAGRFDEASAWLARTIDHDSPYVRTLALPVYAMSEHARGNRQRAGELMARARKDAAALAKPGSETYGVEWTDILISQKAMQEAEGVFAGRQ